MPVLPKLLAGARSRQSGQDEIGSVPTNQEVQVASGGEVEKKANVTCGNVATEGGDEKYIVPSEGVQRGVQKIEAVTLAWTKKSLVALLVK